MKEAIFYDKLEGKKVRCNVCNHRCLISPEQLGVCRVRKNIDGTLFNLYYGKIIASHIDPIEKKPLYHFLPNTLTYSIAIAGCNFKCLHCQNADISQVGNINAEDVGIIATPIEVVNAAIESECPSISYTYTEPTIFVEFALETMKLAHERGLKNIWVSNGYFSEQTFELIKPYLDAINVDLKFFQGKSYREICGARLQPVLDNIKLLLVNKIHTEITTLIIPGLNDGEGELKCIADFIASVDPKMPWHISAFHPAYKMLALDRTPMESLELAYSIGKKAGLKEVHLGNVAY